MRTERGGAFILAVLAVALLMALLAVAVSAQYANMAARQDRMNERRARMMAEAGLQRVLAILQDQDPNIATQTDEWFNLSGPGEVEYRVKGCSFRIQLIDAGALVNLNTATEDQLRNMALTDEQIDSLLDWRSEELQPRTLGAKDEYYNDLTTPYNTKLAKLDTVEDLLLVKGFDGPTLFNPPTTANSRTLTQGRLEDQPPLIDLVTVDSAAPNTTPDGQPRLNVNRANLQQLMQRGIAPQTAQAIIQRRNAVGTFTNIAQVLMLPGLSVTDSQAIVDQLTVDSSETLYGLINLNTTVESVLATLPDLPTDVAKAILARQGGFNSVGELSSVAGVTPDTFQRIAAYFTVGSRAFLVRVLGVAGGKQVALEATVSLADDGAHILKVRRSPYADPITQWNWDTEATQQQVLEEES